MKSIYLLLIVLILSMVGCSDTSDPVSTQIPDESDSLVINVDSTIDTIQSVTKEITIFSRAIKGPFKKGGKTTFILPDTTIEVEIGDYSTSEAKYIKKSNSLNKESKSFIKVEFQGESLNEFSEDIEFNDINLTAYIEESDSISVFPNVIHHMISALYEDNGDYELSKHTVLSDLSLDSSFNFNQTWDSEESNPADVGKILAISGLLMRMGDVSDWDVLPYINDSDSLSEFKHWATFIDSANIAVNMLAYYAHPTSKSDSSKMYNNVLNDFVYDNCIKPQDIVNNSASKYRNLFLLDMNDDIVESCSEYMLDFVSKKMPYATKHLNLI